MTNGGVAPLILNLVNVRRIRPISGAGHVIAGQETLIRIKLGIIAGLDTVEKLKFSTPIGTDRTTSDIELIYSKLSPIQVNWKEGFIRIKR
jgi:hypothetical protein